MSAPCAAPAGRLQLSPVGLGCARIGSFNNAASVYESRRLLAAALELGVTVFDTADIYGQGDSEREVGRLLRRAPGRALVVTKVGRRFSSGMRMLRPLKPLVRALTRRSPALRAGVASRRGAAMACDFSPIHLRSAIEGSLGRLGLDEIDVLLLHSPTADALARDEVLDVLDGARRAGKVGRFGVACDDEECLDAALAAPGVSVVEISPPLLLARVGPLRRAVDESGLAVLVREVIQWRGDLCPTSAVRAIASRPEVASVIVGTTSVLHLEQAIAAASKRS